MVPYYRQELFLSIVLRLFGNAFIKSAWTGLRFLIEKEVVMFWELPKFKFRDLIQKKICKGERVTEL